MRVFLIALTALSLLAGCRKDQIQVYKAPKEAPPVMPGMAPGMGMAGGPDVGGSAARNIRWTVPKGWQEKPASAMRVGSFAAKGPDGFDADISIVSLSGDAGGDLANVNRWRNQIGLAPVGEQDLAQVAIAIQPGGHAMRLVDFVSNDAVIEGKRRSRVIAAIYHRADTTWFFKMTGEDAATKALKPSFLEFLGSLRFEKS